MNPCNVQMDWNSRWQVRSVDEGLWLPVIGWYIYSEGNESNRPITLWGNDWEEAGYKEKLEWRLITSKKKWKKILKHAVKRKLG